MIRIRFGLQKSKNKRNETIVVGTDETGTIVEDLGYNK